MNGTVKSAVDYTAPKPNLDDIRVFVAVGELQSVRGAAERLGLPKSTVSRRLAELEVRLGMKLLVRTTRSVSLTGAGQVYLRGCAPALAQLEDASRALTDSALSPQGTLRVTAPITFGERFLGPVIAKYLENHPRVNVDLVLSDAQVDLTRGEFDIALRGGITRQPSLVVREVGRAAPRIYASPGYLSRRGTPLRPSDLRAHEAVIYPPLAPQGRWTFSVAAKQVSIPVHGRATVSSLPLSVELAVEGAGLVRVPEPFGVEPVERGELVEVLGRHVAPAGRFFVVTASRNPPAKTRVFVEMLVARLRTHGWNTTTRL